MKSIWLSSLLAVLIICSSQAQSAKQFPNLDGENLVNGFFSIPSDLNGKYTLIALAFSKKSEKALKTWFQPTYNQFIYKPETPSLFAGNYDVNVYFVPMFTGAKRPAYQKSMEKVSETLDPKLHPHVLFYKGTIKEYKNALDFDGKDIPYFYVLDPDGNIIHSTSGIYSERKMQAIVDAVEPAWGN